MGRVVAGKTLALAGFTRAESAFIERWTKGMDARTKRQFIEALYSYKYTMETERKMDKMHSRGCW